MRHLRALALAPSTLLAAFALAPAAHANPRPLPFSYQHEQLGKGESELEQFIDFSPTRALAIPSGDLAWYGLTSFTTEFETGLTDRLELGLYVTFAPAAPGDFTSTPQALDGNGMKQRLRYALAPSGEWPIDVSLYGELAENEREIEIELKVLLQRRFRFARLIANLSAEREFYFDGHHDIVLNPSAGLTFDPIPLFQPGIEYWLHAEFPEEDPPHPVPFGLKPHSYLGPTALLQFGRVWWTNGFYFRVSNLNHTLEAGETFGNVWFRSVIGVGL
jgi:hypothetical protein